MPAEWAAGRSARAPRTDASDTADAPLPVEPQASGRRFRTSTTGLDAASGEGAPITQAITSGGRFFFQSSSAFFLVQIL